MTVENIEQTSALQATAGSKPARADSVCKFICERGDWAVSNLQLQKLLYIAQMCYLGVRGERLAEAGFEAWDYGPVVPKIYRQVRMFGSHPIKDVFFSALPFAEDSDRKQVLIDVCRDLLPLRPGQLVEITHWKDGAWAKTYVPGAKGYRIPDSAILDEYRARTAAGHLTAA
jgi:uncharacterized phage-associated protein